MNRKRERERKRKEMSGREGNTFFEKFFERRFFLLGKNLSMNEWKLVEKEKERKLKEKEREKVKKGKKKRGWENEKKEIRKVELIHLHLFSFFSLSLSLSENFILSHPFSLVSHSRCFSFPFQLILLPLSPFLFLFFHAYREGKKKRRRRNNFLPFPPSLFTTSSFYANRKRVQFFLLVQFPLWREKERRKGEAGAIETRGEGKRKMEGRRNRRFFFLHKIVSITRQFFSFFRFLQ